MRRLVVFGRTKAEVSAAGFAAGFARFAGVRVSALPKHCFLFLGLFFTALTSKPANERCASGDSPTFGRPRFRLQAKPFESPK
ncbi:hypothetical protein F506_14945 [Herbaspirillum hiltneri N3]|uniref:Uncharacterized protein n=1 Tax=Herbaspirillum hiltneri N3 TaxID=1262470 RepID=A0ABM5V2K1_9BURK|nr:hypothetical protein F506_14945 [Herbaspirillum hiltneri N3]